MNRNRQKPASQWVLTAMFIAVSAVILVIGLLYTARFRDTILRSERDELSGFAAMKSSQVVRWWHERLGDAIIIRNNQLLIDNISRYLNGDAGAGEEQSLKNLFRTYLGTFDYINAAIIDNDGMIRLSVPDSLPAGGHFTHPLIPEVNETRKVLLTDIYYSETSSKPELDLIIPFDWKDAGGRIRNCVIRFTIDPERILYPLLNIWPTQSGSSETVLLRREGDSVVYLNKPRNMPDASPLFKRPVGDKNLLGAMAVSGSEGLAEGVDYRGVPVVGVIKKIPGSGWFLVVKTDYSELEEQVSGQIFPIRLLLILVISALGALTGWSIWHQRARYYRQRYEAELEKLALRKHFDYILKYANDIVLLMDEKLTIVEINDRASEVYQYSREEILGSDIRTLRLPEFNRQLEEKIEILKNIGSATYETVHRKKDGTTFPVEISARHFEIEGKKYYQSIGRDITERRRIETNLNQLLARYNIATQAARLAVWDWDVVNDRAEWDERFFEMLGMSQEDTMPGYNSWLKVLHPDDVVKAESEIRDAIAGKGDYDTEFRVVHPGGSVRYIKAFGKVVRNIDGSPARMIGINYDITDQKEAERMLLERDFWITESQRIGRVGSYIFDIESQTWTSSEVLDDIFGIDGSFERTLENWKLILHPESGNELLDHIRDHVIRGRNTFDREYRIINFATGREVWVYGRGELRFDESGNPVKLVGTVQDISDRKKTQLSLTVTEQTYTDIFSSVSDAIYIHKPDGIFIDVNPGAVKMYGYSRDELIGMTPVMVSAPGMNNLEALQRVLKRVFETGRSEQFEFWGMRKSGEIFPKEVIANRGKYFGQDVIIATARDITLRKNYEEQLRRAKEKAEESDRLKTAFLHNISHEIRTPMNAIVGFTALLDEPDIDPENRRHFIGIINQSTNQLLGIISDIVDISNIEAGQVKLNFSEVNLNAVIRSLYDQFKISADQQNLLLQYEAFLDDEKAVIFSDKTKLIQVLTNLLGNAVKFTRQGCISFGYRLSGKSLEFFVKDTGIGIPQDKIGKIFDRFYQVDSDTARKYSGAGLGLAICKAYVEMLGGHIRVSSIQGKGTEITFTHPF